MRLFWLNRKRDKSGVSGAGIVAEGIEFSNGKCSLCWLSGHKSVSIFDNITQLVAIHGHHGATVVQFNRPVSQRLVAITQIDLDAMDRKAKQKKGKRK